MALVERATNRRPAAKVLDFIWQKKWWLLMPILGVLLLLGATAIFDFSRYVVFLLHE